VRVGVTLFATLGAFRPPGTSAEHPVVLELPAGSTVAGLVTVLGIPSGMPYIALVNGEEAPDGRALDDGDAVTLFPPLAGGAA
jgi:sulfur carrier protein ThiS